jgi:hypothetical protein
MPYAQVSDVRGLAPHVPINQQSQPSEGDVSRWLADIERNLEATLKSIGYQTPITGTEARAVLRLPVANAGMAMVMRARPNPEQDPENFQRQYDNFIRSLIDPRNPYQLPDDAIRVDAPVKSEGGFRASREWLDDARDDNVNVRRNMKF